GPDERRLVGGFAGRHAVGEVAAGERLSVLPAALRRCDALEVGAATPGRARPYTVGDLGDDGMEGCNHLDLLLVRPVWCIERRECTFAVKRLHVPRPSFRSAYAALMVHFAPLNAPYGAQ